jgi:hypothetical protein
MQPLEVQLARLTTLSSAALRAEWRQLYRYPAPDMSADLLRRGIAWRMQERASGGLPPAVQREIARLMREVDRTGEAVPASTSRIKAGTWLVRDWGDDSHHVLVLDDGYLYRERRYRSLTSIASEITGTHWSGPRFFGLKIRAKESAVGQIA